MPTLEYLVKTIADDGGFKKVGLSADVLSRQLDDLSKKVATPAVDLQDKAYSQKIAEAAVKMDRLSKKVAKPDITLEGLHRAELDILKLDAMLDELDGKKATATVKVDVDRSMFSRLGGLFGGAAGGSGVAAGGGAAGLGALGPVGIGAAILGALALGPAAIPFGLGGLTGAGAAGGAFAIGKKENEQLQKLNKALLTATGKRKKALEQQIKQVQKTGGPELAIFGAFQDLGLTAKGVFTGALEAKGAGFSGGGPGGTAGTPSFLTGLTGILKQFAGFVKSIGPQLGDLFRSSLPFLAAFAKIMERSGKILIPVFTQSLKQLTPSIPILVQGFVMLAQGLAGLIKNLGPGMRASAIIFKGTAEVTKGFLQLIGLAASDVAIGIVKTAEAIRAFARNLPGWFNTTRHQTAVIFDGVRHDIAHIWGQIFQNSIGTVIRLGHNVATQFNSLRHSIANIYDGARHDIAHVWDVIWSNTVGRVQRGVTDVNNWFHRLPGMVLHALFGLGHSLYAFARSALNEFLSGFKSIGSSIVNWAKNFFGGLVHAIGKFLGMSPPHPGSAFWELGANMMRHLEGGIKSRAASVRGAIGGVAGSGAVGGDAAANMRLARSMFPWPASMWPAFVALEMREAGFNRFARNPTSGAYGIPQALPPTKMPFAAQAAGGSHAGPQLSWMFSYIAQRYGNPLAAWAHEQSAGWYGSGLTGGIFNRPTLIGVGERGPERVDVTPLSRPSAPGGPVTVVLEVRGGGAPFEAMFAEMIRKYVRVRGGDVQQVFGRN